MPKAKMRSVARPESPLPQPTTPESRATVVLWVKRHQGELFRYLRVLGASDALAMDLCQEAFLTALDAGVQERGPGPAAAWLRETARRLYLAANRKAKGREAVLDPQVVDAVWDRLQAGDGGAGWQDALRACLSGLPERSRELVEARYGEELSRRSMGQRLGLSEAGVKQALRRVRTALKDCVLERMGDDVPASWRQEEQR